jgi:glycerophosphoryl diester phosphodiesterase
VAGQVLLGGHRGNPAEFPENTLASFASALELGLGVIECDVHLTSDGQLAVIHDPTLERTTNGSGAVGARTMAELSRLDAGQGERIPRLEEVLELARGRAGVAIEVKGMLEDETAPGAYSGIEASVVAAVRAAGMTADVAVISFDHQVVAAVKELEPAIVGGVLVISQPMMLGHLLANTTAEVYSPHWSSVGPDTVHQVRAAGKHIAVWTVDDAETLNTCRVLGVDAVYTNRPRDLLAAIT